jgi:serine protease DegS
VQQLQKAIDHFRVAASSEAGVAASEAPQLGVLIGGHPGGRGLLVTGVVPGSAADKMGLRATDLLTSVDGYALEGEGARRVLYTRVRGHRLGEQLQLEWVREGQRMRGVGTLEPQTARGASTVRLFQARDGHAWIDVDLTAMAPELAAYFGLRQGVLVSSVSGGSLGLKPGDVLRKINGREITSPEQALTMLSGFGPGDALTLEVRRRNEVFSLSTDVPAS